MFGSRFWLGLGSGEALNECITGEGWPSKPERNRRLEEAVRIIRDLWTGKSVTYHGLIQIENAKLYTQPERPPLIIGAANTPQTAEWVARWADGLITISRSREELQKLVEAFRRGDGEGKPMYLQVKLSYSRDDAGKRGRRREKRREKGSDPNGTTLRELSF